MFWQTMEVIDDLSASVDLLFLDFVKTTAAKTFF